MRVCTREVTALLAVAIAAWVLATGLSAQEHPPAIAAKSATPGPAGAGLKIILLKPSIRVEDVRSTLPSQSSEEGEYERLLLNAAEAGVASRATFLEMDKLDAAVAQTCAELDLLASRLARGNVNQEAANDLMRLSAFDKQYAVLVQSLRLKTGPGASWNSITGQITSSMAGTLVQAALLSNKGEVLWKSERLVRNRALKPENARFTKMLASLYQDFDVK